MTCHWPLRTLGLILFLAMFLAGSHTIHAQDANNTGSSSSTPADLNIANLPATDTYLLGEVGQILENGVDSFGEISVPFQRIELLVKEEGSPAKPYVIKYTGSLIANGELLRRGDTLVLNKNPNLEPPYVIIDRYRFPALIVLTAIFFGLVIFLGRRKGIGAILGLGFTLLMLTQYIIPQLVAGANPVWVTFSGALIIAVCGLYLAHGLNRRTTLSIISTVFTLLISIIVSYLFVSIARLYGTGSEDSIFLQLNPGQKLNLQGLFLGGIIIGTLGVLDDITTAQTATVEEIHQANGTLPFRELYRRGISVGTEHIASLVNTLILAYAGASLPLFLLLQNASQPLWVMLNGDFFAEEIVRTLIGSITLLLAVPITTALAAWHFGRQVVPERGVKIPAPLHRHRH